MESNEIHHNGKKKCTVQLNIKKFKCLAMTVLANPFQIQRLLFLPTCETWKNVPKNMLLCCSVQISNIIYLPSPHLLVCFIEAH